MIASVSGQVLHKSLDHVVVEAAGVGYMLSVSANTLEDVSPTGSRTTLLATMVVREDAMQLFGFSTADERDIFNLLTSVSGVGPKVALAVLSAMSVPEVETALVAGDHETFQKVPGIGKRTAERLVVELKDKVVPSGAPTVLRAAGRSDDPVLLARDALLGLGYSLAEAESMLAEARGESPEELIASALRGVAV
ncbi:MAG: Holliday junction branch migration protein RuvA [Thermoleophilaceae bacterium]|nr:Holliday junction branch migration protein RuvA [Thermoleophilaceae bacterium]